MRNAADSQVNKSFKFLKTKVLRWSRSSSIEICHFLAAHSNSYREMPLFILLQSSFTCSPALPIISITKAAIKTIRRPYSTSIWLIKLRGSLSGFIEVLSDKSWKAFNLSSAENLSIFPHIFWGFQGIEADSMPAIEIRMNLGIGNSW